MNKTTSEWAAWNSTETDNVEAAKRIGEIIDYLAACELERKRLLSALQALYDEQNGPPLIRHEKRWQAAMDEAEGILKESPHPTVTEGGTR